MNTRRNFIQQLGLGMAIPALSSFDSPTKVIPSFPSSNLKGEDFWTELRRQFPLTSDRVYLNNGTFGPAPFSVLQAMEVSNLQINTSGEYGNSDQERVKLAEFFRIKPTEFSITHNTTEGINIMAWGVPMKAGDEVILTTHEHAGNALPWLNRAKLEGIVIRTFEPKPTQAENLTEIQKLIIS